MATRAEVSITISAASRARHSRGFRLQVASRVWEGHPPDATYLQADSLERGRDACYSAAPIALPENCEWLQSETRQSRSQLDGQGSPCALFDAKWHSQLVIAWNTTLYNY